MTIFATPPVELTWLVLSCLCFCDNIFCPNQAVITGATYGNSSCTLNHTTSDVYCCTGHGYNICCRANYPCDGTNAGSISHKCEQIPIAHALANPDEYAPNCSAPVIRTTNKSTNTIDIVWHSSASGLTISSLLLLIVIMMV